MSTQKETYFFITDISGYTSFMIKNQMERDHGTLIITELMKSLIKEIRIPMEIAKLEGDAIFFVLLEEKVKKQFKDNLGLLSQKLLHFMGVFEQRLREMQASSVCDCGGCSNIGKLNLKIIAHFGKASVDQIENFKEYSGVDVILVHRLLKNHVKEKRYLLMTEAAYQRLPLPSDCKVEMSEEIDPDLGRTVVYVYLPPEGQVLLQKKELSSFDKFMGHLKLVLGCWLLKYRKNQKYNNLP